MPNRNPDAPPIPIACFPSFSWLRTLFWFDNKHLRCLISARNCPKCNNPLILRVTQATAVIRHTQCSNCSFRIYAPKRIWKELLLCPPLNNLTSCSPQPIEKN